MHSIEDKMVSREARRTQHSVEERPREPSFSEYVTEVIDAFTTAFRSSSNSRWQTSPLPGLVVAERARSRFARTRVATKDMPTKGLSIAGLPLISYNAFLFT